MLHSILSTRGQLVIPRELREKYQLKPGIKIVFEETANGISLIVVDKNYIQSTIGILKKQSMKGTSNDWAKENNEEEENQILRQLNRLNESQPGYKKTEKNTKK